MLKGLKEKNWHNEETIKENQMKLKELKNIIFEIEISLDGIDSRFDNEENE